MRARVTLGQIGTAVFNGGFSTFLALVLLAGIDAYSYKVFFTVRIDLDSKIYVLTKLEIWHFVKCFF